MLLYKENIFLFTAPELDSKNTKNTQKQNGFNAYFCHQLNALSSYR